MLRRTLTHSLILGLFLGLSACTAPPPPAEVEQAAVAASDAWLRLIDAGDYAASWAEAADYFKGAITADAWAVQATAARAPLGACTSRTVKHTSYHTSLPGAPDGEYVVIQYTSSFANKQSAIETVTPMRGADGTWRVSGYFIQ